MRGQNPPVESDAEWLHDFYSSFSMHANASDVTEAALQALSRVVGPFAFVVYDSTQRRVWAARDKEGEVQVQVFKELHASGAYLGAGSVWLFWADENLEQAGKVHQPSSAPLHQV